MTQDTKDLSWKMLGWIADVVAAAAFGFCVWIAKDVATLKEWKAETAGNRWSSQMQADYAASQSRELTKIWSEMASMKTEWLKSLNDLNLQMAKLPSNLQLPPKWWEEWVRTNIADHAERIKTLERRDKGSP